MKIDREAQTHASERKAKRGLLPKSGQIFQLELVERVRLHAKRPIVLNNRTSGRRQSGRWNPASVVSLPGWRSDSPCCLNNP